MVFELIDFIFSSCIFFVCISFYLIFYYYFFLRVSLSQYIKYYLFVRPFTFNPQYPEIKDLYLLYEGNIDVNE